MERNKSKEKVQKRMETYPNVGCEKTFKWRVQLKRHKEICTKPVIEKIVKFVEDKGLFKCIECGATYKHKTG